MDHSAHLRENSEKAPCMRAGKPSKACVPCRARKVRCDAAVVGLPCSSCTSRHCTESCVLSARKRRTTKNVHAFSTLHEPARQRTEGSQCSATTEAGPSGNPYQFNQSDPSRCQDTPASLDCQTPRQPRPDLQYLNILQDAVNEDGELTQHDTPSSTPYSSRPDDSFTPRNRLWNKLPQLDDVDNEYLAKKGVFDLPPSQHLDALIKTYFDHVYPFTPVIDRTEFIKAYQSGDCSLFLLRAILTTASLYTPANVISGCGFESCAAAQESFFQKAKLLHDFGCEKQPLFMLQGSIILGVVILDHPSDRDFDYWLHNSIRLAAKLDIRNTCIRNDPSFKYLKLYRRIWFVMYSWDIFRTFINTGYSQLLENAPGLKPITESDWEVEDLPDTCNLVSTLTSQQKASLICHSELSLMFGQVLTTITNELQQDPSKLMQPVDTWRKSLATKMHIDDDVAHGSDVYYLDMLAMSYRFESILCRLVGRRKRWHSQHGGWSDWAKRRLRSAILELDTIAKRVLASGTIRMFPMCFITTMPALLALHIESALDPAEPEIIRSMARISINQTMLILAQGQEIPALKRALPVFEDILSKKNLYLVPQLNVEQELTQPPQDHDIADIFAPPYTQVGVDPTHLGQVESSSFYGDFFGFDFLDGWQIEQLEYTGRY